MNVYFQYMNVARPGLIPLLRSDTQGRVLAQIVLHPQRESSVADIAARLGISFPTVYREVQRLVDFGFVSRRRVGRGWLVRADTDHALYRPVREIIEYAYGPAVVLPRLLAGVDGVEDAFIFGSWAARAAGQPGPDPADIDVLVIGRPDRGALYDVAREAEAELGREVNVRTVDRQMWEEPAGDAFIETVQSRSLLRLQWERKD